MNGRELIIAECRKQRLTLPTQVAYVLATAEHETNGTFKPVREAYWLKNPDAYLRRVHADYYPFYGRGFVQLTWKRNYEKYGKLLGLDLVGNPDLALDPEVAAFILVHGFIHGGFTKHNLMEYVNDKQTDFWNARRCINGVDAAGHIAKLAEKHLRAL